MEAATQRCSLNKCSWEVKKTKKQQKNTCEKVHVHVYFSKVLRKLKVFSSYINGKKYFQGTTHFFSIKIRRFLKQLIESFGPNKTKLYFWLKINFRKMASNKHKRGKEGWYLAMIEKFKTTVPLNFTVNPILIYDIWISNKVSRLSVSKTFELFRFALKLPKIN